MEQATTDLAADPIGFTHDWRAPQEGEPAEEGGVCTRCGAYANSSTGPCPFPPDGPAPEPTCAHDFKNGFCGNCGIAGFQMPPAKPAEPVEAEPANNAPFTLNEQAAAVPSAEQASAAEPLGFRVEKMGDHWYFVYDKGTGETYAPNKHIARQVPNLVVNEVVNLWCHYSLAADKVDAVFKECVDLSESHAVLQDELSAERAGHAVMMQQHDEVCHQAAELKGQRDAWEETAKQAQRGVDYYQDLLKQIGQTLGKEAYISDDGSKQDDVLAAKLPELVKARLADLQSPPDVGTVPGPETVEPEAKGKKGRK